MNALMDPTELSEVSALTLSRLEQNDPTLHMLTVSNLARIVVGDAQYWPINNDNENQLSRLGVALGGSNKIVKFLRFERNIDGLMVDNNRVFWNGLRGNRSIHQLNFSGCNLSNGTGNEILSGFVSGNKCLGFLSINGCNLGNELGSVVLIDSISRSWWLQ